MKISVRPLNQDLKTHDTFDAQGLNCQEVEASTMVGASKA